MTLSETKKTVERTFDSVAENYDSNRFFQISAESLLDTVELQSGFRLLDVSTGTGAVALAAATRCSGIRIDAIDFSEQMLAQARRKASERGFTTIQFQRMDAERLDFPDDTFDVITCGYGLFFFPELDATFAGIIRTLKPGGSFLFSTFTPVAFSPCSELFFALLKVYGVEPLKLSRIRLQSREEIEGLCRQVPHLTVKVRRREIRQQITADDWWRMLNTAGYKALLDQLTETQRAEFKKRHLAEIGKFTSRGSLQLNIDSFHSVVTKRASSA